MNSRLILERLHGLMQNPQSAWFSIGKEYHNSIFRILRTYFIWMFIALPVVFTLATVFSTFEIRAILINGIITPVAALTVFLLLLYIISIVLEEVTSLLDIQPAPMSSAKVSYLSALPFLSLTLLLPVPWLGPVLAGSGFVYQIYLTYLGGAELFKIPAQKKVFWLIAVLLTLFLMLVAFLLFIVALLFIRG